ncbi:MAG: TonB-dependent receptor, partial [Duncaniella sp.]|nr:TonB-dependent receptor [Duncaniella sp.]
TNQTSINYTDYTNEVVPFSRYSQMNPFYDKRTEDGEVPKYVYQDSRGASTVWNPLWDTLQNSYSKGNTVGITDNFQFEWRVTNRLRLRGSAQYSMTKASTEVFTSPNATSEATKQEDKRGSWNKNDNTNTRWSGRIDASYGINFGVNTINAIAGAQVSHTSNRTDAYGVVGYLTDQFSNPNFSVGYPEGGKPSSKDNKTRNASFYGNVNYAYDMRYLFDFNLTSSGASQFGIDNPFTTTWSVGLGWNISNEKWFKNKYVSYWKINGSYGNPGNQNYDAKLASSIYKYLTTYTNPFGLAAAIDKWGNRGLKWQKTQTFNIGTTATLFSNRWNLSANYQTRRTEPQLVSINLPGSTGVTSAPMNVGGTDNRSWSASTTVYIIRKGDFSWYVSGNVNHNTTKYMHIGNSLDQYNQAGKDDASNATLVTGGSTVRSNSSSLMRMYDGASTTGLYVVRSLGIDPATGNELFMRKDGTVTYEWSSDDEILWGDTNPKFTGSASTSLTYKGFSFA